MKKIIAPLLTTLLWISSPIKGWAYTCMDATGQFINSWVGSGSINVYVNLAPSISAGENLVVDLSNSIFCRNDQQGIRHDMVSMLAGSAYGGALQNFSGSLVYYGSRYSFPLHSQTAGREFIYENMEPWRTQILLTPISTANSVAIKSGDLFASLVMYQVGSDFFTGENVQTATFTWNLYANNDVYIPTGGCDVSARNVTVTLPDFPGSTPIPITVYCSRSQNIAYSLSGSTDGSNSIFRNSASYSPAQGIGVQIMRNGSVLPANSWVSLGWVGPSSVDLGLSATYSRTTGQVVAGNVQSIIGVTFIYQ